MSAGPARDDADWTTGPAKWAAVVILGASSLLGMAWSILRAPPRPAVIAAAPIQTHAQPLARTATASGVAAVEPLPPDPAPAAAPVAMATARKINLNTATSAELELLPGIGPAVARRIIDHRAANGPFKRIEDLDDVKGIGPRTLDKLRDLVTVD